MAYSTINAYNKPRLSICTFICATVTAVAKAKDAEMDALYEKLDGPEGEKFAIRLAKARHRGSLGILGVKTVKSADGRV
ncbi:unnamed protein product [Heligmosomoides polygyrus]|uniref:ADF-H domain-containing protein n=1 Tax=Heligmosomoides polygyrus TaxID=6339 RepID=A0A183FDH9_HELPZ|nr:unnamed protein product [Heligmosomoides polygyrus]